MIRTESLSEQIERELHDEILCGHFAPGQRLPIEELSERWGVSTTPVRDAVKRLETAGLLEVIPRRGVYVATIDQKTFKHVFDLRIALECLAVKTATALIPDERVEEMVGLYQELAGRNVQNGDTAYLTENDFILHELIVQYSDNPKLIDFMQNLQDLVVLTRSSISARVPDSYEASMPEHLEIVYAIQARDGAAAEQALRCHLKNVYQRAVENWNEAQL
jgi:DNA-binding GntR family transcriptional regulator